MKFSVKTEKFYRKDIDGLRAVAILLVVFYHLFPDTIRGGFVGVDIFFVISGYIITTNILSDLEIGKFSYSVFLFKRIRRLYPALLLVLGLGYTFGLIFLMPKEFAGLAKHIVSSLAFVQNFILWREVGYFDDLPQLKPLLHLWSLSIEEQFYIIWPLLLIFIHRQKKARIPILTVFLFLSFMMNIASVGVNQDFAFYWPFTRFWEILSGCLLAILHKEEKIVWDGKALSIVMSGIGFLMILFAGFSFSRFTQFPGFAAVLPVFGASLVIFFHENGFNRQILSFKVFTFLGLISYPLYLWHWILISFDYYYFGQFNLLSNKFILLILSILLGFITFRFVETPIRKSKNFPFVSKRLLGISFLLVILAFITFKLKGFPLLKERELPSEARSLLDPEFGGNLAANWREHSCFLYKEDRFERFERSCGNEGGNVNVMLWGDSHAAALYTGFKAIQSKNRTFGLWQYTTSLCPPILDFDYEMNQNCRINNAFVFNRLSNHKPDILILQASWDWGRYEVKRNIKYLEKTFVKLNSKKIPRVILFGQSPTWMRKLPTNIVTYHKVFGRLPSSYTSFGLFQIEETRLLEEELKKTAIKYNIEFISMIDILCPNNECLLYVGDSVQNVTSLDQGHLSDLGASYVVQAAEKKIFPGN